MAAFIRAIVNGDLMSPRTLLATNGLPIGHFVFKFATPEMDCLALATDTRLYQTALARGLDDRRGRRAGARR